jgi:thioredoxin reductase (NADPH)
MERPVIYYVDDEIQVLDAIRQQLFRRYAADYEVLGAQSPGLALKQLEQLKKSGREVAILLADCYMPGMNGPEFLVQAHSLFPEARRGLMVDWGAATASALILNAMASNSIDAYESKPLNAPDEEFYQFISRFLKDWAKEKKPRFEVIRLVGELWERRAYELRDLLNRNSIPFGFYEAGSDEAQAVMVQNQCERAELPVVIMYNGEVLENPTNTQVAEALGASTIHEIVQLNGRSSVDVVIIGAGPAGLSAAVYAASEGFQTVVLEREAMGGQSGLSTRIRNYLGFPTGIRGDELSYRAYQQAWLFGAAFTFALDATAIQVRGDKRVVVLSDGTEIPARVVILAMGVTYQRLEIPNLEELIGAGVFYGAAATDALAMRGKQVYVVGGGNSAGQAALHLAKYAAQVTMVVKGSSLAMSMSDYLFKEIVASHNIDVRLNTRVVDGGGDQRLEWILLEDLMTGRKKRVPAEALFVLIGASPQTGWLPPEVLRDPAGFILSGADLMDDPRFPKIWPSVRPPFMMETSLPGVFAIGDVRSGSLKRVAAAVGDGSIAVQFVHQYSALYQETV